jgi:hypothetical protein
VSASFYVQAQIHDYRRLVASRVRVSDKSPGIPLRLPDRFMGFLVGIRTTDGKGRKTLEKGITGLLENAPSQMKPSPGQGRIHGCFKSEVPPRGLTV